MRSIRAGGANRSRPFADELSVAHFIEKDDLMFNEKDIICFLGDSITANGRWMAEVYQTLRKKHRVKCYNCGVVGGTTKRAEKYLYSNCLIHNPDYVITMFGLNDIARWNYSKFCVHSPERREEIVESEIALHKASYEAIIKKIRASGAEVIMCLPTPYDEISDLPEENLKCQYRLDEVIEFQKQLAEKYEVKLIDFSSVFKSLMGKLDLINTDRVHPTVLGQHVIAQTFLKGVGEIDAVDYDTPFEFEDWNKARFDIEISLEGVNYTQFGTLFDEGWMLDKTYDELKSVARERMAEIGNENDYTYKCYKAFIEKVDIRQRILGEIVEHTIY